MRSKIELNLLPPVIRESIDPDILNRALSIEWSIDRDTGENERGYVDGSNEDYLSSQNLLHKSHSHELNAAARKAQEVEWTDNSSNGIDSGLEYSPVSPSLDGSKERNYSSSPLGDISNGGKELVYSSTNTGSMKRHPRGQHPFPIYRVNQGQLQDDVVFEVAPNAKPGEKTVHYERSNKIMNEQEMDVLGLDPEFFGPNTKTTLDEQEVELIETGLLKGGSRELKNLYLSMKTDAGDYFDRQRAKSASLSGLPIHSESSSKKETVSFGSVDEIKNLEERGYLNGQWMCVAEMTSKEEQSLEKYMAERIKCTIILEPPMEEIKVEPKPPISVEFKKPLKEPTGEEEKLIEDPNLLWMRMGPTGYGPPFGTIGHRKAREEEWIGPPCELCHKQIEERRCMLAENMKFHCWHFACSFCLKTLKPADFLIAEANRKPYCLNCHKREFPQISLVNLNLQAEQ